MDRVLWECGRLDRDAARFGLWVIANRALNLLALEVGLAFFHEGAAAFFIVF